MNGISKGKRLPSNAERVISFKSFSSAEKVRLKTAYPFLSPSQIRGKVKEEWKLMEQKERQSTSRAALKFGSSNDKKKTSKPSPRRRSKEKLYVCDTPERVNMFKLNDFRRQHAESYENDFKTEGTGTGSTSRYSRQSCDEAVSSKSPSNGEESDIEDGMDTDNFESLESDEDNDGVLIRRTDLGEFGNNFNDGLVVMDTDDVGKREVDTEKKAVIDNGGAVNVQEDPVTVVESNLKKLKKRQKVKDIVHQNIKGTSCRKDNIEETFFKSPNPKGSASKRGSGARRKRQSAPEKLKTPNMATNRPALLTPHVSNNNKEADKYTTPQMDEVLQKLTINEVNKAPQKRRHSYDNPEQIEKIKAMVSGRRVTRSLLAVQSTSDGKLGDKSENENIASNVDNVTESNGSTFRNSGKRNSKLSLRNKKKSSFQDETNNCVGFQNAHSDVKIKDFDDEMKTKKNIVDVNNNTTVTTENTVQMNPSGDASQVDQESLNVNEDIQEDVVDSNKGDSKNRLKRKLKNPEADQKAKKRKFQTTTQGRRRKTKALCAVSPTSTKSSSSIGSPSSVEFASSCTSLRSSASSLRSLSPLRKSYRNTEYTNPALEKVLQSLRSTRVTSPSWSCGNSSLSSPRLLSPALSGVSELSSLSGQSSEKQESDGNETCVKTTRKAVQEKKDLCDMFNDVTPPESKTKGLYKTNRLVSSGRQPEEDSFKQLFEEDRDEIFF